MKESEQRAETGITQKAAQPGEEKEEQRAQTIATKLSVQQAAKVMGVSPRSIYTYMKNGALTYERYGHTLIVDEAVIRTFKRRPVGRERTSLEKPWHLPTGMNTQCITMITVPVKEGQQKHIQEHIRTMRKERTHLFPGTVARYITASAEDANNVQILLVWRTYLLPPPEEIDKALTAFKAHFAAVFDWEHARYGEQRVLAHI